MLTLRSEKEQLVHGYTKCRTLRPTVSANILCLPLTLARLFYLSDKHTAINIMKSYAESCTL